MHHLFLKPLDRVAIGDDLLEDRLVRDVLLLRDHLVQDRLLLIGEVLAEDLGELEGALSGFARLVELADAQQNPSVALSIFAWCVLSSARSSSGVAGVDFENPRSDSREQPIDPATNIIASTDAMHIAAPATDAGFLDSIGASAKSKIWMGK